MVDPAPGHVRNVEKTVHAPEIDEGAVFGDVLDHALDRFALIQAIDDLGALLGPVLLENCASRHDDVVQATVQLEDLERLLDAHERRCIAHRAHIDLRARKERDRTSKVHRETALHPVEYGTLDLGVAFERLLESVPGFLAARLVP